MGGLAGHMLHPHENPNLKIEDFCELCFASLVGKMPMEEKIDGFNIHVLNDGGQLKFARSGKDLDAGGFTAEEIYKRFSDDRVRSVFTKGCQMIKKDERWKTIPDWSTWHYTVNVEIVVKGRTNIMFYPKDMIVFHNLYQWVRRDKFEVEQILPLRENFKNREKLMYRMMDEKEAKEIMVNMYKSVFERYQFMPEETLCNYYQVRYVEFIQKNFPEFLKQDFKTLALLFMRFFKLDKTNLREIRKGSSLDIQPILDQEKEIMRYCKDDLDEAVLKIGTEILKRARGINYMSGTRYRAASMLEEAINHAHKMKQTDEVFFHRWNFCDREIFGIEGVVVPYKGINYKWTGPFAPINRLIGGNR